MIHQRRLRKKDWLSRGLRASSSGAAEALRRRRIVESMGDKMCPESALMEPRACCGPARQVLLVRPDFFHQCGLCSLCRQTSSVTIRAGRSKVQWQALLARSFTGMRRDDIRGCSTAEKRSQLGGSTLGPLISRRKTCYSAKQETEHVFNSLTAINCPPGNQAL